MVPACRRPGVSSAAVAQAHSIKQTCCAAGWAKPSGRKAYRWSLRSRRSQHVTQTAHERRRVRHSRPTSEGAELHWWVEDARFIPQPADEVQRHMTDLGRLVRLGPDPASH